ncbi:MAG: M15 family metallopeptidase [Clostridium sp.]|nr:M15 family metallopeptidase [Clostridium sp.]
MNVKTIVTIALIGLLGVGTAAGIFLSDRSQQQEPPSADIQQEEKEEAPVESSSQKEEEQEQSSQETKQQQLAEEFAKEKEEYYLLLANAENPLPQDWSIQTEEVQNGYEMDKRAAPAIREMIQAAKEDGVELMLCSAYRSVEKQQQLFDRSQQAYMAQGMSEEEAYAKTATETAIPGTSEHQTGLAADIVTPTYQMLDAGFADTPAGQWLSEHAAEYGFVLRYPQDKQEVTGIIYESWHYRFVGKTHAKLMKESGLCLEEYLQQELPEGYTGASDPYDLPKQS